MHSTYTNALTGASIDYYEVQIRSIKKQIYPDLPATDMVAYDGLQPGPTFHMRQGRGKSALELLSGLDQLIRM